VESCTRIKTAEASGAGGQKLKEKRFGPERKSPDTRFMQIVTHTQTIRANLVREEWGRWRSEKGTTDPKSVIPPAINYRAVPLNNLVFRSTSVFGLAGGYCRTLDTKLEGFLLRDHS